MPPQPPFLLDTNVPVALIRRKELGGRIEQAYGVASNRGSALISVVTVGEMFSLARQWSWPENKVHELDSLLEDVICVDISNEEILRAYGQIHHFLIQRGNPIGDNDMWIAATCAASGAILLTTDKDFDPLDGTFIRRFWIDPHGSATQA
jgi:tRNA(fMet)-specific endonuclease VapC